MLKQNFGWAWSMWVERLRVGNGPWIIEIDRIVIREVQYELEVYRCRNEVNFKGSSANSVGEDNGGDCHGSSANSEGGDSGQYRRTDSEDQYNVPTLLKAWG
ncbi:hypothetical protein DPMN_136491 [Dreissena polymorpha]|uniref:Uncharacterized protein n=1 Tax=Dreissena polymorpha TaxID=45954 RepID=A0A9D4G3Y0_DREPO|nr:hypothetical protein DPMN_136491 [Dreissena polymorpha]